ncbi:MAG: hypothetical protein J7J70_01335, partial [Deltaproteobacteria bacterium]|nr:hypothetical protein [Candidatus Tharpellaceae bacterium]
KNPTANTRQPQRIITLYNKVGLIEQWIEFDPRTSPTPSDLSLKGRLNPYRLCAFFKRPLYSTG